MAVALFEKLTRLRHEVLPGQKWLWNRLRKVYRALIKITPRWTVKKMIGPYGPFKLDRRFAFSNFAKWGRKHNKGFEACIKAGIGKKCVIDVGAHIGLVTMPMSHVLAPGGTVYAFEPAEANYHILNQHLSDNSIDNVMVLPWLVGESDKEAVAFHEETQVSGMNSVVAVKKPERFHRTLKKQVSLDSFCADHGLLPQVIKIDAEGAEIDILAGGLNIIKQSRPQIYLSVHPRHIALLGRSLDELHMLIEQMRYDCVTIEGEPVVSFARDEYLLRPRDTE